MGKKIKEKVERTKVVWKEEYYVKAFKLAKAGLSDTAMAAAMGVSVGKWLKWRKEKPALREAIREARKDYKGGEDGEEGTFQEYVYKRLSPRLKELWDKIHKSEKEKNGILRIEGLLADAGKRIRQQLFIYALVHYNFNFSEACRRVNISKQTFERWCTTEPGFGELLDEIHWHKGNLYEGALVKLVKQGDPSIVKFVNSTYNKERGYTEKMSLEVSGKIETGLAIDDLNLPLATRKQILQAIRDKKEPKLIEAIDIHNVPEVKEEEEPTYED